MATKRSHKATYPPQICFQREDESLNSLTAPNQSELLGGKIRDEFKCEGRTYGKSVNDVIFQT